MSNGNEYLTNEMMLNMEIKSTINKIERKLEILERVLEEEKGKLYWYHEGVKEYKPNSPGIIQGLGFEIDDLCSILGTLYKVKDTTTGKSEVKRVTK